MDETNNGNIRGKKRKHGKMNTPKRQNNAWTTVTEKCGLFITFV